VDRLDSHNEYWLETEAGLRTDFNIFGMRLDDIQRVKRKSVMKEVFTKAGIKVARGRVVGNLSDALDLVKETGYPIVAKPDVGVGAAATYKILDQTELENFFVEKPPFDYLLEEYIRGDIETFDGLTDRDGNPVFLNSLIYSAGIMETVLADDHVYYYTLRAIPSDLEEVGRRILREFGVRERFFHFEFFRQAETGELCALEVNMRPPGGLTLDMFNYSCDIDIYDAWASIVAGNRFPYPDHLHKFFCCYVGRKFRRAYVHSHEDVLRYLAEHVVHHEPISGAFSNALGNYGYLIRSPELSEIVDMAKYIQE
jgi:biotin carboxylase